MPDTVKDGRFAVIAICERNILFIQRCADRKAAVDAANQALENWMLRAKNLDPDDPDDVEDSEGDDWQKATEDSLNAWCNCGGDNWDAHVVDLDDPESTGIPVVDAFAREG